jgi:hypothetical protein
MELYCTFVVVKKVQLDHRDIGYCSSLYHQYELVTKVNLLCTVRAAHQNRERAYVVKKVV